MRPRGPGNEDVGQAVDHSRTQSPSYARCDEGLWPNPYSELASDWLVLTPDIVFLPCFYGIRLWICRNSDAEAWSHSICIPP